MFDRLIAAVWASVWASVWAGVWAGVLAGVMAGSVRAEEETEPRPDGFVVPEPAQQLYDFLDDPALFSQPTLSPNGRYLAYVGALEGPEVEDDEDGEDLQRVLVILDLEATGDNTRRMMSLTDMRPTWLRWASNERLLMAASFEIELRNRRARRYYRDNPPRATRVLSFSSDLQGSPAILFSNGNARLQGSNRRLSSITDYLPDEPDYVIMPADYQGRNSLWRVNVVTGESEIYEQGTRRTVSWHTVDGVPVMRFDVSRSGRRMYIYSRASGEDEWVRTQTIRRRDIQEQQNQTDFEWAGQTGVPGEIYVRAQPGGSDFVGIHRYDLASGTFLETVAERDDYDIDAAFVSDYTGAFLGYSFVADRREFHFSNSTFGAHYRGLLNFFGDQIEVYPWSFGGDRMILRVAGPTEIGSYYLYDFEATHIELLSLIWPRAMEVQTFEMQPVSWTARDGLAVSGYVTWPEAGSGPDTPLVVMPHGGPEVRDSIGFDFMSQYLANQGYAVFQPNFRGSYGFGSQFMQAGHRQWGLAMQDDIEDGVRHLIEAGEVDPDRICLVGFSYGGYAALSGMARSPDLYNCAVAGGSVTDLRRFLDFKEDISDEVNEYWIDLVGDRRDSEQRPRLEATSPVNQAGMMRGPILLYHGEDDPAVPVRQSRDMADALEDAGVPHVYLEEPEGGHNWGETDENFRIAIENISSFLADAMDGSLETFEPVEPREPEDD